MPPPKLVEKVLSLLLPPACREHVVGDLHERYQATTQYVKEALAVLAPVIFSRMRRTTDAQSFAIEALTIYLCFSIAAFYVDRTFLLLQDGSLLLLLPTAIAAVCLLFCNAYSNLEKPSFIKPVLQSIGCLTVAFLGQMLLFDLESRFAIPLRIMLLGSLASLLLVSTARSMFPPFTPRLP